MDCVYDEIVVGLTKQEWYQLLKYVWDKKFNFLYLDTGNSFNKMYHKNFNTLELHTHMDELTDFGEGKWSPQNVKQNLTILGYFAFVKAYTTIVVFKMLLQPHNLWKCQVLLYIAFFWCVAVSTQ